MRVLTAILGLTICLIVLMVSWSSHGAEKDQEGALRVLMKLDDAHYNSPPTLRQNADGTWRVRLHSVSVLQEDGRIDPDEKMILAALNKIPIASLELSGSGINDEQFAELLLPDVRRLTLARPVTAEGLIALITMPKLEELELSYGFTDTAFFHLQDVPELRCLTIRSSRLQEAGFEHLKLCKKLKVLRIERDSSDGFFGNDGLQTLAELPELQELCVQLQHITDEGLVHLRAMPKLERLELTHSNITDNGLEHLKQIANLRELTLSHDRFSDAGMAHVGECSHLERLNLREAGTSDVGVENLKKLHLKELVLAGNKRITSAALEHLADMQSLEILDLADTAVDEAGLKHLMRLTNLRRLNLGSNMKVSEGTTMELQRAIPHLRIAVGNSRRAMFPKKRVGQL